MKLHQLGMDVVNNGWVEKVQEFFEMANDLEMQVSDIIESLESVQNTLNKLLELYPENLAYS